MGQSCLGRRRREEGKQASAVPQFNHAAYRSRAMKGWRSASLILETLYRCWCYKRMLKLKVGASFQVLTSEQKAQPTLVHLLKLVKIKTPSRCGSCRSRGNDGREERCLSWTCSTRLFKDALGHGIRVGQDGGPHCERVCVTASCLSGCFSFVD